MRNYNVMEHEATHAICPNCNMEKLKGEFNPLTGLCADCEQAVEDELENAREQEQDEIETLRQQEKFEP